MELAALRRNWEGFGREDPMWSILTVPGTRGGRWDERRFFSSGRQEVVRVLAHLRDLGWSPPQRRFLGRRRFALDFGCGVGRLTQALAEYFDVVDGVDIAASMIRRALEYNRHGARCRYRLNVRDDLSQFGTGEYAFVYSSYVLQHMPPELARRYVAEFVRLLSPDGVAVFGLPVDRVAPPPAHEPLPEEGFHGEHVLLAPVPATLRPGERAVLPARLHNRSPVDWPTRGERLVWLGARWEPLGGAPDDPARPESRSQTGFAALSAGGSAEVDLELTAPARPGRYLLRIGLVQEFVAWFPMQTEAVVEVAGEPAPEVDAPRMEMYTTPRAEVEAWVGEAGGRVVDVTGVLASNDAYFSAEYVGLTFTVARADGRVSAGLPA
jgi:SAM-dependent methyltransferase